MKTKLGWIIVTVLMIIGAVTGLAHAATNLYVALGDSFSAGPGSGIFPGQLVEDQSVYEAGTLHRCNRSSNAYPQSLANAKNIPLRNVSCGGATVDNILNSGQFGEPAQINAVTPDTTLVTLTIGGNDIGFNDIVGCVVTSECSNDPPVIMYADVQLLSLQGKVQSVFEAIHSRAPSAKIFIAGYAKELPDAGQPAVGCVGWLSPNEQALINNLEMRLNAAIQAAASTTGNYVTYLDTFAPSSPFMGHDLVGLTFDACSLSVGRMINGIRLDFNDGSFHPNKLGQQAYFQMFNAAV